MGAWGVDDSVRFIEQRDALSHAQAIDVSQLEIQDSNYSGSEPASVR
jgi:hypothetical protein